MAKKKTGRKAPTISATKRKVGTRMRGNDGKMWQVKKSGKSQRWMAGAESFAAPEEAYAMAYNDGHRDGRNKTGYDPSVVKLDRQTFRDAYKLRAESTIYGGKMIQYNPKLVERFGKHKLRKGPKPSETKTVSEWYLRQGYKPKGKRAESFESVTDEWIINRKRSNPLSRHYIPQKASEDGDHDEEGYDENWDYDPYEGEPYCESCEYYKEPEDLHFFNIPGYFDEQVWCTECVINHPEFASLVDEMDPDLDEDTVAKRIVAAISGEKFEADWDPTGAETQDMLKHSEDYRWENCDNERSFLISILSDRQLDEFLEFEEDSYSAETKLGKDSCCCGATKTNPCACMIQGVMNCNATCPCSLEKKNAESTDEVCWKCIHSSTPHPPGSARECNVCHTHKPATAFTREDAREVVEQYSSGYEHYCDACDIEMESWEDLKAGGHDLELLGPDAPRYGRWYGKREYKCKICEETYRSRHFDPSDSRTTIEPCSGSPIPDQGQCPACKAQIDHLVESMHYSCPECGKELEESDSHWEMRPWDEFGKTLDPRYQAESFDSEWNCVICGHKSTGYGNNPEPVASAQSGRCCDTCNTTVVIPTRLRDSFRAEEGCSCPVCGTHTEVIREYFDDDTSWVDLIVCDNCCWMEELEGNEEEYEAYMEEMLAMLDEEPDADLLEKPNVVVDTSWDWSDGVGPPPSQQTLDLEFDAENQSCRVCGETGHNKRTCPNKNREECWSCGWDHNTDKANMLSCSKGYDHVVCSDKECKASHNRHCGTCWDCGTTLVECVGCKHHDPTGTSGEGVPDYMRCPQCAERGGEDDPYLGWFCCSECWDENTRTMTELSAEGDEQDWYDSKRVLGCPVCKSSSVRITWDGFGYIKDTDNIKVFSDEDSLDIPMADHEFEDQPKMGYYCNDCSHISYHRGSETDFIIPKGHAAESFSAECVSCTTPEGYWRGWPLCSQSGKSLCVGCCDCNDCRNKWNQLEYGETDAGPYPSYSHERKSAEGDEELYLSHYKIENQHHDIRNWGYGAAVDSFTDRRDWPTQEAAIKVMQEWAAQEAMFWHHAILENWDEELEFSFVEDPTLGSPQDYPNNRVFLLTIEGPEGAISLEDFKDQYTMQGNKEDRHYDGLTYMFEVRKPYKQEIEHLLEAEGDELTDEEKQEVWNVFHEEAASIEDPDLEQIKTLADKYLLDVIDDETPEFFVDPGLEDYYQYILTDPTYPEGGEPEDEEAAAMFEELKHVRYWATILTDQHIEQADTAAKAMMAAGIIGEDKELFDQGMLGLETNNQVQRERELIAQWLAEGGVHEN